MSKVTASQGDGKDADILNPRETAKAYYENGRRNSSARRGTITTKDDNKKTH